MSVWPLALMGAVEVGLRLAVFVVLIMLSALFSGSEVALFSITTSGREVLERDGSTSARRVLWLLNRPRALLIAILLLNTVVNVGAAMLAAVLALEAAEAWGWSQTAVLVLQAVALTFVLLVVSEIAPKVTATQRPVAFAKGASRLL